MLEVDEDNVQMAKFVEEKLKVEFKNGRAFYEFSQMEEDLLFYRDVVMMPKVKTNTVQPLIKGLCMYTCTYPNFVVT